MFRARKNKVAALSKYTAIKLPDSEFKLENFDEVECVVLDSDNAENVEVIIKRCTFICRILNFS